MENILSVNLETQTSPKITEAIGKNWIEFGTDDYRNRYPQFLIDLYYNSSTHAAIINATSDMIAGDSIVIDEDSDSLETYVGLSKFINACNSKESLHDVVKKLAFDFKLHGAYAINLIWNKERTGIAEIYHVPVEKVRVGKPNDLGVVECYYISSDWENLRKNPARKVEAFNTNDRTSPSQLIYTGNYSPNMELYYTPDYVAACNWALIDQKVSEFHLSNICNGFSGSYFISFANGVPSMEERIQIEHSLAKKFTGAAASGKFVLTFSDDKNRTPEITPIAVSNADKQYLALQELLVQNILTGHRVTSPMLMGIKNDTGLGNNADELNSAFEVYLNSVVMPYQKHILKCIQKILVINNINLPIKFVQNKPVTSKFTLEDMKEVMTTDEIREELGLKPLEEQTTLAKVGSMITDGIELPLYDTVEEAEAKALAIGCKGHHEHTQDGKTYYMPCESHDDIISLSECTECKEEFISPNPCWEGYEPYGTKIKDGKRVPNCIPIQNKTELDKWLYEYGEVIGDDYELVDEEDVADEHEDFDFESTLNELHRVEFNVGTGRSFPNASDEQDGIDKDFNLYKVRYQYAEQYSSKNTRDFCSKMMQASRNGKVYRKKDILALDSEKVNKGWGPGGSPNSYSIWKFKGGGNCGHWWRRRIYFYKLGINTGTKIQDATDVISTAKARSQGFYPEPNDPLVAEAPKNMPKSGFVNKEGY
tara:strand:- start:466 stop:2592 length:2127 start_codon:yes stop_codon:yes gene_type:complete